MTSDTGRVNGVPREVLLSFFLTATEALKLLDAPEPVNLTECRSLLLQQQRDCLDQVVREYNDGHVKSTTLDTTVVQQSLSQIDPHDETLQEHKEMMNTNARLAFARLVLKSECQRTSTVSLNKINQNECVTRALQTSQMTRSAMLEFCALAVAAIQLKSVLAHVRDSREPLWLESNDLTNTNNSNNQGEQQNEFSSTPPPMKRLENLQRLLLQAIGYDADMGLKELARQIQMEGNDDVELVETIRRSTTNMTQAVLGSASTSIAPLSNHPGLLLSDQDQGGVTRVVSVQHSETLVQVVNDEEGGAPQAVEVSGTAAAPVSQSMRDEEGERSRSFVGTDINATRVISQLSGGATNSNNQQQLQMAHEAQQLRQSLVQELQKMSNTERTALLHKAEQALHDFQSRALEVPPGAERIEVLRSMDDNTKKLLTMHRIWQEEQTTVASE